MPPLCGHNDAAALFTLTARQKVYNAGFRVVFEPRETLAIAAGKEQ